MGVTLSLSRQGREKCIQCHRYGYENVERIVALEISFNGLIRSQLILVFANVTRLFLFHKQAVN